MRLGTTEPADIDHSYQQVRAGLVSSPPHSRNSPGVGLLILVVQRLQTLVLLELAQLRGVRELEERRSELDQPLGVDGGHLSHVLLSSLNQLVVYHPAQSPVRKS